jgi:hypothetical protein
MDNEHRSMSYKFFQPAAKKPADQVKEIVKWANGRTIYLSPKHELFTELKNLIPCEEEKHIPLGLVAVILVHID